MNLNHSNCRLVMAEAALNIGIEASYNGMASS